MTHIEEFINKVESQLPVLADTSDLIRVGIFSSVAQAVKARKHGYSPEPLWLSAKRIVYPKEGVIRWLKERPTSFIKKSTIHESQEEKKMNIPLSKNKNPGLSKDEKEHRLTLRLPKWLVDKIDEKIGEKAAKPSRNLWILQQLHEITK